MLIGDSHANHFTGFIDELAKAGGLQVLDYTLDACPPIFNLAWGRNAHYARICEHRNQLARDYVAKGGFRYVVLAGNWPAEEDYRKLFVGDRAATSVGQFRAVFVDRLRATLKFLVEKNAQPILILDNVYAAQSPKCPLIKLSFNAALDCDSDRASALRRRAFMATAIAAVANDVPSLVVIDPADTMCDDTKCHAMVANVPLYLDATHLNDRASRMLGKLYLRSHANPLSRLRHAPLLSAAQ
jgi:hypothetical protein